MNASDVLVGGLMEWGIGTVFGLPGDGINGVFEALRKHQGRNRFVHVRDEESAAFIHSSSKTPGSWASWRINSGISALP